MDSGRGSRSTASDEDYEDGLYTDYSRSGEDEHEHDRYPYGIRRYLYDPQTPLHRLHLASFSDSEQYALVPGQMPSWRVQDGVESTHPLRRRRPSRASEHRDGHRRRRRSTSTILSSPSHLPSAYASSSSPSLVSLNPALTSMPAAGSSDPDSREPSSSYQTTATTTTTPASCQQPPENAAADKPTGPEHDENHALGHGDGPGPDGPDMSMSAATTDHQAAIWGHHHDIPDSGPFVIEGCGPYTLDTSDWDRDAAGIEYWTLDMIDAEFEAFEKEDDAAQ